MYKIGTISFLDLLLKRSNIIIITSIITYREIVEL